MCVEFNPTHIVAQIITFRTRLGTHPAFDAVVEIRLKEA